MFIHLDEASQKEIQQLQNEISKGKCHINELILLLEGVSTNSDRLPTGLVEDTVNAPMSPGYLMQKKSETKHETETTSQQESHGERSEADSRRDIFHDSFDTIDDLDNDADFSEGAASLKQQMTHTIGRYEQQIKELQNLYDHDIFSLETEKKELREKLNDMKEKYETAYTSKSLSNLTNAELIANYEEQLAKMDKHFNLLLEKEKQYSKDVNQSLLQENERMKILMLELEERYSRQFHNTEHEIEIEYSSNIEDGLRNILGIVLNFFEACLSLCSA